MTLHFNNFPLQIYLAAGKVFALEDRVQDLHQEVNSESEKRKISELEDEVARTVARVHQSEKDVSLLLTKCHICMPVSRNWMYYFKELSLWLP